MNEIFLAECSLGKTYEERLQRVRLIDQHRFSTGKIALLHRGRLIAQSRKQSGNIQFICETPRLNRVYYTIGSHL
jgi:hypothetical protein